ncbi:MAG: hypothetical protein ACKO26_09540 [Planctomycetota bacterium]
MIKKPPENRHLLGGFRWAVVLILVLLTLGFSFAWNSESNRTFAGYRITWLTRVEGFVSPSALLILSLALSYVATMEASMRVIIAALPAILASLIIDLLFGWSGYVMVTVLGFGLFSFLVIHHQLCQSKWIGIKCRKCFNRGTIKRQLVKKVLVGTDRVREENGGYLTREFYRRTIRSSCSSCGLAWTRISVGVGDGVDGLI